MLVMPGNYTTHTCETDTNGAKNTLEKNTITSTGVYYIRLFCTLGTASYETYIYIKSSFCFRDSVRSFFSPQPKVCDSRNWNSRSNSFVRAPSSGSGSNAPRPAVPAPHIDVNADGCQARQARNCKNSACREGIPEILVVS